MAAVPGGAGGQGPGRAPGYTALRESIVEGLGKEREDGCSYLTFREATVFRHSRQQVVEGARDLLGDLAQVEQELVEQVLAYCPTPALLSARLVCRSLADLVAGSSWEPGTRLTRARLWQCWKGGPGLPAENLDLPPF